MRARPNILPVLCLILAGCGGAAVAPAVGSPAAVATPAVAGDSQAPALTPVIPGSDPGPSLAPGDAEAALLHGMRADLQGTCVPLREALPAAASGAVTCVPAGDVVARATVVLFETRQAMLDAYLARIDAEGILPKTNRGRCPPNRPSEGGYVPGDDHGIQVDERGACWFDADGIAHYVATLPPFVLLIVDGRPATDASDVERFAWLGNRDDPGSPTLWAEEPQGTEK